MIAAAGCRQDVRAHKHMSVFLYVCVCLPVKSVCPWTLVAGACIWVLYCRRALHVHERSCVCLCILVRTNKTLSQSQCVTLGLVPQCTAGALALGLFVDKRMLGDKWFSTCQSELKDRRWEKREVRDYGKGKWWRLFKETVKGTRRERGREKLKLEKEKEIQNQKKRVRERIYNLALGHHIAQVPVSNFPLEMTASISAELFA